MGNIILLFACLAIGMALRKSGRVPENAHTTLNAFIIHVSLPALTLLQIHRIVLQQELLYSVAMPWMLFAIGAAFFWVVSKAMKLSSTTTGALMLSGGLANTSFVGLPMIEDLLWPQWDGDWDLDRPARDISGAQHVGYRHRFYLFIRCKFGW
jgi:predicted permease